MKNTFGNQITVTLFGESHGEAIGVVIDGLSPGIEVSEEIIASCLAKRRPSSGIDTARREPDHFRIVSGVFQGKTCGTPVTVLIPNEDTRSKDYTYGPARPSHADYTAFCKYHGFEDYRGGGHFSGRITAALVAAGGILIPALEKKGIRIGTHIFSCGGVEDLSLKAAMEETDQPALRDYLESCLKDLRNKAFPVLDDVSGAAMTKKILEAAEEKDSVGGVTETVVSGLPSGLGEPWFDSVESELSHILFSIGGIKGVEFGSGFDFAKMSGSEANDSFRISEEGQVYTETNHNGGINGGITNGMPVLFRCAVKPTASIAKEQKTIDFQKQENIGHKITGRHDPAIVRRVCPVIDSVTAIVIADLLAGRFGTDYLGN
ncbi:MAG: chorismate synthase [Parasporobacterium sp.]|nr:chorismate synthase [Parasporobacterium sp.]